MTAYYNEIEPYAAQWLRNLIQAGHIAPGIVDERSIEDVFPSDLRGFTQCHFFAGIGVWSYALRAAGWSDDRPVWTGSCPCQPFSEAGKGTGFNDERHLWPFWHHLIKECRPAVIFGEQVASKDAGPWIDLVQADVESLGYPFGAIPFPAAGVGSPNIRDRLYWVANSEAARRPALRQLSPPGRKAVEPYRHRSVVGVAHTRRQSARCQTESADHPRSQVERSADQPGGCGCASCRVDQPDRDGCEGGGLHISKRESQEAIVLPGRNGEDGGPGPTNGIWRDADWIFCRDGKWRPVEPGTFPLANGSPARVGRLRAYGNAINAEAARVWIEAVMEAA